jgi:D-serine deaminase-like pyridoxal phosphate-dependent protein
VGQWVGEARALFEAAGLGLEVVSAGGTPRIWQAHEIDGLTEYRAGTYVYNDRRSVAMGSAGLEECALHVHVTVISMPTPDRCVIDAGSKALTSDTMPTSMGTGHGLTLEYPDAIVAELSEEHGVVDLRACKVRPSIGERLRVLPNHVCPVSNLVDEVVLHRRGVVEAQVPVAARGKR